MTVAPTAAPDGGVDAEASVSERPYRRLARILVVAWLVATVAGVLTAERESDIGDLRAAVRNGSVDVVQTTNLRDGAESGRSVAELRWERRGIHYVAEVTQLQGVGQENASGNADRGTVRGDLSRFLSEENDPVRLEADLRDHDGGYAITLGWRVGGWLLGIGAVLLLATLLVLRASPEPWRATRWGWFWLVVGLVPLGPLAFLLLGGPARTPPRPAPTKAQAGRLGGVLALFVVLILG